MSYEYMLCTYIFFYFVTPLQGFSAIEEIQFKKKNKKKNCVNYWKVMNDILFSFT